MWVQSSWGDVVSFPPNHAMGVMTNQSDAHKTPNRLGGATSKSLLACFYGLAVTWPLMAPWLELSCESLGRVAATAELLPLRLGDMSCFHSVSNHDRPYVGLSLSSPYALQLGSEKGCYMVCSASKRNEVIV
jgi:hypothetical protein